MPHKEFVKIIRCLINSPGGIVCSPICHSQAITMMAMFAPPTSNPIIVGLVHAKVLPEPSCSARRIMMAAGMNSKKPNISSSAMTSRACVGEKASFFRSSGTLMRANSRAATPPTGRLI
jgi:hypothetical protein